MTEGYYMIAAGIAKYFFDGATKTEASYADIQRLVGAFAATYVHDEPATLPYPSIASGEKPVSTFFASCSSGPQLPMGLTVSQSFALNRIPL